MRVMSQVSDSTIVSKTARKIGATHLLTLTASARSSSVSESVSYDRGMLEQVVAFEEAISCHDR